MKPDQLFILFQLHFQDDHRFRRCRLHLVDHLDQLLHLLLLQARLKTGPGTAGLVDLVADVGLGPGRGEPLPAAEPQTDPNGGQRTAGELGILKYYF